MQLTLMLSVCPSSHIHAVSSLLDFLKGSSKRWPAMAAVVTFLVYMYYCTTQTSLKNQFSIV